MTNINDVRGITDAIRHDTRDLIGKIAMAIAIEEKFIDGCNLIICRFTAEDKSSTACRMACYEISETENYHELLCILADHEKKLSKLREIQSFIGGWERDFK